MKRLPPLGSLEAFVVVAQRGTLRLAADDLNLSVSALSRRIQALESYLGRQLFDRLPRQLRLTPQGATLMEQIVPLFDKLSSAVAPLSREEEVIRLNVLPTFASQWLLPRLHRFEDIYPRASLELDTSSAPLTRLGTGLDAAIVIARSTNDELYRRELGATTIGAVCAPDLVRDERAEGDGPDSDGAGRAGDVAGVERHTLLLHRDRPEVLGIWLAGKGGEGLRPRRIVYYDSGALLRQAIQQGQGIGLLLGSPFDAATDGLVRPFGADVPSPYSFTLVCRPTAMLRRGVQRLHDWLLEEIAATGHGAEPRPAATACRCGSGAGGQTLAGASGLTVAGRQAVPRGAA